MRKLTIIIGAIFILTACSEKTDTTEIPEIEASSQVLKEETKIPNLNTNNSEVENKLDDSNEIINEKIGLTSNENYKASLKDNEKIINATLKKMETLGIAYLTINLNEKITNEEAQNLAKNEIKRLRKENENIVLVTSIQYNGQEIFNFTN